MNQETLLVGLAGVLAAAAPIVFAVMGETLSERAGVINLSMNDGKGFNDGAGGTVVLTMLHLKMNNRGFPETTEKVVEKLGLFFAQSMFDGLKSYRK